MPRGPRTKVARGIYADAYGHEVVVKVHGVPKAERFPRDAAIEDMQAWQDRTRGTLLLETPRRTSNPAPRTRDGFRRAAIRYLKQLKGRPGAASDASHLEAWVERFGDRARVSVTAEDVRLAFAAWRTTGQRRRHQKTARAVSPQTMRHRYRVLKKLYRVLDGPRAKTPCDDIKRPHVPRSIPKDVPLAVLKAVARELRSYNVWTYARFMVLATTGKGPSELMRATPSDVDLQRRRWRIHPSKGRPPQILRLNSEMVAALKFLRDQKAWGEYDTSQYARHLRACGWPAGIRPYNVRHALAIELLRRGADLGDIQAHLGHASIETSRRFYAGIIESRERLTSKRLEGRLGRA